MSTLVLFLLALIALAKGVPVVDHVHSEIEPVQYHHVKNYNENPHLDDLCNKESTLRASGRYSPLIENEYHLLTRLNPSVSQPIVYLNKNTIQSSNYDATKRTIVTIHGWLNSATSDVNAVLVNAFLTAGDYNVMVVDWSAGAGTADYDTAVENAVTSGEAVAIFLNWLCEQTETSPASFHIVGHSLGGQQAGIVGRNLDSPADYITALDPAGPSWTDNENKFQSDDGSYTEVIHTNAGMLGYETPLGQVDFYPNGGINMTGCASMSCDHARAYYYMAESVISGGFTATKCESYTEAMSGTCTRTSSDTLQMGGTTPKTGESGVYYLATNADQPFSMG